MESIALSAKYPIFCSIGLSENCNQPMTFLTNPHTRLIAPEVTTDMPQLDHKYMFLKTAIQHAKHD